MRLKNLKQLALLALVFCFAANVSVAQNATLTRYFDADWNKISKDSAFYYTEMVKEGDIYKCTSYWMKSKKLNCTSSYRDTGFAKPVGLLHRYYENGQTQDSTYFNEDVYASYKNSYHYYDNGKLWVHYTYNSSNKKETTDAYDLKGQRIDDYVFMREAAFEDGDKGWQNFIKDNLNGDVPVKKGAANGRYEVIVVFVVSKNGKVTDVQARTSFGYGMEEEAIRVISKSPKWIPGIVAGKLVNAYRRQPITFVVKK